ncbi:MAG: EAL domain-containing protein [Spirochaetales bacterium]|nr:EAL domain-containing protein [Spirochaetales bacterium]
MTRGCFGLNINNGVKKDTRNISGESMAHIEKLKNNRPTIAVLVASMNSFYQEGIMRGVADGAEERGVNLVVYSGGPLKSPDPMAQSREAVFDLVNLDLVDGVIIPVGSHTRYLNEEEKKQFLDRFSSVPVVNLSTTIEGCINILPDFRPGLSQLMDHFVNDHGYKKIAFFRGPRGHLTSDVRTEMYREELKKHNLPVDENLIIYSDLGKISAQKYVAELLDDRKVECDAILTLNDSTALAVINVLKKRGLSVPGDMAVAGTMDDPAGLFFQPPLTTIKEPIYELGKEAAHALADVFEGKEPEKEIYIPTSLVIRRSCGCKSKVQYSFKTVNDDEESRALADEELRGSCLEILKQSRCFGDSKILLKIMDEYEAGRREKDYSSFYGALKSQLNDVVQSEKVLGWLSIVARIQLDLAGKTEQLQGRGVNYELFVKLITLKNRIEDRMAKYHKYELEYYRSFFTYMLNSLNIAFNLSALKTSTMDLLNITDLYISVYAGEGAHNKLARAKNIVAIKDRNVVNVAEADLGFPSSQLIPATVAPYGERYSLMVFPLSFRKKPLGFLTFNLSSSKGIIFENLQVIISAALKNELQIQDLKKAEERFSDIAHSTSNWLWETDENHEFTYCSLSVSEIIGYRDEEMLGKNIRDFSLPDGNSFYQHMMDHDSLSDRECWFKHQNGNIMCLRISAKPILKNGQFTGYRGVFKDVTEQKFQEEKINHLAYYDILTDLPNRALFQEKLEKIIQRSAAHNKRFALMFIDVDRFKYINDSMGHDTGDLLLKKVAGRLGQSIRGRDVLARLGGDEFTIILPDTDEDQVITISERIMKNLIDPIKLNDSQTHITISLGIAMYPLDGDDTGSLLKKADNAMYQAKRQGRNGYVFYDRRIEQKNSKRKTNEENLYHALENDGFILHFQPQVDAQTGEVRGAEALVRIGKDGKTIYPDNFIPLAEELGLIWRIDEWVFRESCRQQKEWREKGLRKTRISINISARQLRNEKIVERYSAIMKEYEVLPEDIKLEVTENVLIENEDLALDILQQFQDLGISIAMDDFGTGYSSLQFINRYPIDTVKIDKSFVSGALSNKKSEAIIEAIIHLAQSLDMKVIAEGVETVEQYAFIKSLGCDEIQGYYFYKPCLKEDFEKLL